MESGNLPSQEPCQSRLDDPDFGSCQAPSSQTHRVTAVAGLLVAGLGAMIIYGWHSRLPGFVQIHSSFVPMQYNTAVGFVLCGLGLFASALQRRGFARVLSLGALLLGAFTLAEYVFQVDLGIDQILMEHYITMRSSHPGRMAPTTALAFCLAGMSLFLATSLVARGLPAVGSGILGSCVFALGLGSVCGYLLGTDVPYGFRHLTPMAVHTAGGFVLLGTALAILSWRIGSRADRFGPSWLPASVAIAGFAVVIALRQSALEQHGSQIRQMFKAQANSASAELRKLLNDHVLAISRMARRWEFRGGIAKEEWIADAKSYLQDLPEFRTIEWVHTDLETTWAVSQPDEAVEPARNPGVDVYKLLAPDTGRVERSARLMPNSMLSGGDPGYLVIVPLHPGNRFDGFLVARLNLDAMLASAFPQDTAGKFALAIFQNGQRIWSRHGAARDHEAAWAQDVDAELMGRVWRVRVWPEPEFLREVGSRLPNVGFLLGLVLIAVLTLSTALFQAACRQSLLAERGRRQLHELNQTAIQLNAAGSLQKGLELLAERARRILKAHAAIASFSADRDDSVVLAAVSTSEKHALQQEAFQRLATGSLSKLVVHTNRPLRLTESELEQHPRWRNDATPPEQRPPLRGWLAAPVVVHDGSPVGLIQLSDKQDGPFDREDERVVFQLARMAGAALEARRVRDELEQRVVNRTVRLQQETEKLAKAYAELERFNRLAVDRELRMIGMKQRINRLSEEVGQPPPYNLSFVEESQISEFHVP